MVTRYRTVARDAAAELEVKRSRFRCALTRVETEDAARAAVDRARLDHRDARHHCSALVLGPDAEVERAALWGDKAPRALWNATAFLWDEEAGVRTLELGLAQADWDWLMRVLPAAPAMWRNTQLLWRC